MGKKPLTHFTARDISFLARRNAGKPYAKFNHQKNKAAKRETHAHQTQTENAFLGFSTMNNSNIREFECMILPHRKSHEVSDGAYSFRLLRIFVSHFSACQGRCAVCTSTQFFPVH